MNSEVGRGSPIVPVDTSQHSVHLNQPSGETPPPGASSKLDSQTTSSIKKRLEDFPGGKFVKGMGKEYGGGFRLIGGIMDASAHVSLPKESSAKEIGKFAFRLGLAPFKTGVGLLLSANVLLGMTLATPILAVKVAFPKQTDFLFRSKNKDDEGIR